MFAGSGGSVGGERLLSARGMRGEGSPGNVKTHSEVWSLQNCNYKQGWFFSLLFNAEDAPTKKKVKVKHFL